MADSSLDEIIRQKRMNRFGATGQNQIKKGGGLGNRNQFNKKGKLFQQVQKDLGIKQRPVSINTDARNKIIQKQRLKFRDARDKLGQIAKKTDARDKLNKMRKGKPGKVVQQQKQPVMKKKIVNFPKQQFKTGQTRMKGSAVIRTVAGSNPMQKKKVIVKGKPAMVKKTLVTQGRRTGGRSHPIANNPSIITIKNNHARPYETYEVVDFGSDQGYAPQQQHFIRGMHVPTPMDTMMAIEPEPVMRSRRPAEVVYAREYEPEVRPSRLRITAANSDYRVGGQYDDWQAQSWEPSPRMQQRKREYIEDSVEYEQVYPKKVTVAAPVRSEPGTKVVVSNLHHCVSVEDMEELLGTVGSVSSVRMVRQGVAEAFFVNQEDAYRSVELFNNRQLDGQPMKVMVVRKKTTSVTSAPSVQARSVLRNARGRSGYYV